MSSKTRFPLLTFILFIALFLGGLFYVKPLWDDVENLATAKDQKQAEKDTLTQKLENLKGLQKELGNVSEVSKQTTFNAIPERFEEDRLIQDITAIAQKNDVVLNGISFSLTSGNLDKIKRATLNVNLTGNEDDLISFLKGVESNQRKLVVKSITVQNGKATNISVARANFSLTIETYYQDRI